MILNGMFWVRNSGAPWSDLSERYDRRETVYGRCQRWTREGLAERILNRLYVSPDDHGRINWSVLDVDGSNARAHRSAAGASNGRGRTSPPTTPWDDPAEALARSFIL